MRKKIYKNELIAYIRLNCFYSGHFFFVSINDEWLSRNADFDLNSRGSSAPQDNETLSTGKLLLSNLLLPLHRAQR